jgi:hypothetical protein
MFKAQGVVESNMEYLFIDVASAPGKSSATLTKKKIENSEHSIHPPSFLPVLLYSPPPPAW